MLVGLKNENWGMRAFLAKIPMLLLADLTSPACFSHATEFRWSQKEGMCHVGISMYVRAISRFAKFLRNLKICATEELVHLCNPGPISACKTTLFTIIVFSYTGMF